MTNSTKPKRFFLARISGWSDDEAADLSAAIERAKGNLEEGETHVIWECIPRATVAIAQPKVVMIRQQKAPRSKRKTRK